MESLEINKEYTLKINNLSSAGEGIGRINNFVVFVKGALPGEDVLIKITKIKKKYAQAKLMKVLNSSLGRIVPRCSQFQSCGGCQLQHLEYGEQLKHKREVVEDALRKIGSLKKTKVLPILAANEPWYYRNKVVFQAGETNSGLTLGFYEQSSYQLVSASECLLFSPRIKELVSFLIDSLRLQRIKAYNKKTKTGYLKNIMVKESKYTGEMMLVFITADKKWFLEKLVHEITRAFPKVISIYHNINLENKGTILGREMKLIYGQRFIQDRIGELRFNISPLSFFQVNNEQAHILYQKALEYAQPTGEETVLDAYCGIGTIAISFAKLTRRVIGIEMVKEAINDARINAALNGVDNAKFIMARVEHWLPQWVKDGGQAQIIIVDPPRKGCASETLEAIVQAEPQKIIYISCNPATLARDLKYLTGQGYQINQVQPVDMFPQTGHVESIILMTYCGDKKK